MSDLSKVLAPLPAFIRHQTGAASCAVLVRDAGGEYHIVAEGRGWEVMVISAAARVLGAAQKATGEEVAK